MSSVVPTDATPYVQGFPSFTTRVIYGQWIYTDGSPVSTPPKITYVGGPYYLTEAGATMFAKPFDAQIAAPVGDSTVGVWWAEVLVFNDPDVIGDVAVQISHPILPTGSIIIAVASGPGPLNIANALAVEGSEGGLLVVGGGGGPTDWSEINNKPSTFAPSAHNHSTSEINSGTFDIARMTPGSRLTLIWDNAQSRWEDTAGAAVSARPGSRNDILLDLIGGLETDRPAWANQPGDKQYVTETP